MAARRKKRRKPDATRFSKKIVTAVLVSVAAFTIAMLVIYVQTGGIPDALVAPFFAFAGGEAGALGLIRYGKAKYTSSSDDAGGNDPPAG